MSQFPHWDALIESLRQSGTEKGNVPEDVSPEETDKIFLHDTLTDTVNRPP